MKSIRDIELKDKRVFVRVDFNVPLDGQGQITDDARIRGALPTLRYILEKGGKPIVASHLGRPKGKPAAEFSMAPAAKRLESLLQVPVALAQDCIGPQVEAQVSAMNPGQILMLENLRFHGGEEKDDPQFAKSLAALCDVYVNDAFAVCHRANASVSAITRFAPVCVAGLLLKDELDYFEKAMSDPVRPLAAVVGGAKVSSKLAALKNILPRVDKIIIGGAMANTFLKQMGLSMGASKLEDDQLAATADLMADAARRGVRVYLPVDLVVADRFAADATIRYVPVQEIPAGWMALDIGPASSLLFSEVLYDARTIVWNGPMGAFEMAPFSRGTLAMAQSLATAHALTIVGGGDTDAAVHQAGLADRMTYISTGGGAFLTLLEGNCLPAVEALIQSQTAA